MMRAPPTSLPLDAGSPYRAAAPMPARWASDARRAAAGPRRPWTPDRGRLILTLGLLSLLCCLLAPFAWAMAGDELRRIADGEVAPTTRGLTVTGRWCAIIATCWLLAGLVGLVLVIALL